MIHTTHKETMINGNLWEYRGSGYTKAFILVDRLSSERFIGFIPTKDEFVLATRFENGAYGWSHYTRDTSDLNDLLIASNIRGHEAVLLEALDNLHLIMADIALEDLA